MTKELSPDSEQILHYLQAARAENRVTPERPLSGAKLAKKFGLSGNVEARAIIHELRAAGHWIGSGSKGYYYATSWEEVRETVKSLSGRAESIAVVANAMKAQLKLKQQTRLAF